MSARVIALPLVVADYRGGRYLVSMPGRYLELAPGARAHVPVDTHAPLDEFEKIAADVPVFRITRPGGGAAE